MGIKRGANWTTTPADHPPVVRTSSSGARPITPGTSQTPIVGVPGKNGTLKQVSEFRRGMLIDEDPETAGPISPLLVYSRSYNTAKEQREKMTKTADALTMGGGYGTGAGSGGTVRQAPEVYSPLFQMANLQLPRERITMNAWNRSFYNTHPLVHNCINLHATYPISKINIKCKDAKIEQFFEEMAEDIDLVGSLQLVAQQFWCLGEVFPYLQLDENTARWKSVECLNPDYIHVKKSPLGGYSMSMRPDAALLRLIQSNNPDDIRLTSQIDPEIVYHIRKGNNIPLDNFRVSHLKNVADPSDVHGTSIIVSIYKDLMLYDKLRESKFAQADNLVNPITLIKVGGTTEGEYHPTAEDLENYRQVFENAQYDRDFKIITHAGVSVERVGASGQIIDIAPDMAFILDNICFGLMVPKNVLVQEGAAFQSATIGLEVLKQRYESFRNMMARWLIRKVFAPISELQEFYTYKDGEKKLIVPSIDWNKLSLYDSGEYISTIKELANNPQNPMVSKATLFRSLGLSEEEETRQIKEEAIQTVILQKELAILQTMSLGALRSLNSGTDIIEGTEAPLPGTAGAMPEESGAMPGGDLGGSMPGLGGSDLGGGGLGLPPMPTSPGGSTGAPASGAPATPGPTSGAGTATTPAATPATPAPAAKT
jgi:hypothetical protein